MAGDNANKDKDKGILNSLSPDLYDLYADLYAGAIYAKTASELWTDLKDTYDKGANPNLKCTICNNLGLIVGHLNGTQALITKIGDLKLNDNITLYDVLVVPEYNVSLLSVHKLSRDNKFVGFDDNHCYIQDFKANKNVRIGRQFNGPYLFDVDSSCKKFVSNNSISSCFVSKTLWHQRLGHPADQVLDVLKTTLNLDSQSSSDHLCDACNKAKQTREPFSLSDHKSSKIGELVHLDVWGPYKITSRDGLKYFLTIVDDISRAIWVYMLKGKDDVYDSITTCVYTPQENGIAERKHRHLLNVARSLMFQGELPLSLWSELFPFKMKNNLKQIEFESGVTNVLNHKNFFDCDNPKRPNDEGRVSSDDDDSELSPDENQGNDDSDATSMDETNNTHPEGTFPLETDFINISMKLDVNNAFLYGELEEDIYMTIPKENDFVQSANDHSLYTKSKNNKFIALLVYVDDIVVTGNCVDEINKFKVFLKSKFKIKDLGQLKYFLGIEVIKTDKDLCLSQKKYCLELLKEYGLLRCKPVSTPMVPNSVLPYEPTSDDPLLDDITGYQKLLGKLICLTHTRPDIAYYDIMFTVLLNIC
uniref:Ribonuclease H-like domain-containing protein n=1 Tax=Tanacetum cinerariifolium TaxID=118510 RepID=A0A6L2MFQ9_TANCI|nr:ribonuclease H-like domain-containing protein [Tanacetum cinerariifolium]